MLSTRATRATGASQTTPRQADDADQRRAGYRQRNRAPHTTSRGRREDRSRAASSAIRPGGTDLLDAPLERVCKHERRLGSDERQDRAQRRRADDSAASSEYRSAPSCATRKARNGWKTQATSSATSGRTRTERRRAARRIAGAPEVLADAQLVRGRSQPGDVAPVLEQVVGADEVDRRVARAPCIRRTWLPRQDDRGGEDREDADSGGQRPPIGPRSPDPRPSRATKPASARTTVSGVVSSADQSQYVVSCEAATIPAMPTGSRRTLGNLPPLSHSTKRPWPSATSARITGKSPQETKRLIRPRMSWRQRLPAWRARIYSRDAGNPYRRRRRQLQRRRGRRALPRGARGADPEAGADDRRRQRIERRLGGPHRGRVSRTSSCCACDRERRFRGRQQRRRERRRRLRVDRAPQPGRVSRADLARAAAGERARRTPSSASSASLLLLADDPEEVDGSGDAYHVGGMAWRRDNGRPLSEAHLEPGEIFSPCAAAALYRRDAFLDAGGFDESFFAYYEDSDLAFRLRLLGHRCFYEPAAVVHHLGFSTSGEESPFTVFHSQRNLVWAWVKNMPRAAARRLPPPAPARQPPQPRLVHGARPGRTRVPVEGGGAARPARRSGAHAASCSGGERSPASELRAQMAKGAGPYLTGFKRGFATLRRRRTPRSAQSSRRTSAQ